MNFQLRKPAVSILTTITLITLSGHVSALDSDKTAPVAADADTTSIDFRTGKRILTGNVVVTQGSMSIEAAKIVLEYKNSELDIATAYGNPVKFKQIPEGHTEHVFGEGKQLKLEQSKDLITLTKNAKLTQKGNVITGKVIYYNIKTSKMTVKSDTSAKKKKTADSTVKESSKESVKKTKSGRTRVFIEPGSKILK